MTATDLNDERVSIDELDEERVSISDYVPGKIALRDTWFPLIYAREVRRRPVRRTMHGQPVWFSRDRGILRATEDSPADIERGRRRASEFTGGIGEYPLVERYGYAWVWYGNPEAVSPDLVPSVPHMPVEGMPEWYQCSAVFSCCYELVCENLLDLTHTDYLHSELSGEALSDSDEIFVSSTSETVTMTRVAEGRLVPRLQRPTLKGVDRQDIRIVTLVHVRNGVCLLHAIYTPGMDVRMMQPVNPEMPTRSRTLVTFDTRNAPAIVRRAMPLITPRSVGSQDEWALRPQNLSYLRPSAQKDQSSRFDRAGLRYRKVYQDLVARQKAGDFSYLPDGDPARDVTEELALNQ